MEQLFPITNDEINLINYYKNIVIINKGAYKTFKLTRKKRDLILYVPQNYSNSTIDAYILKHYKEISKKAYFCYSLKTRLQVKNDKILYLGKYYDFILKPSINKYYEIDNNNLIIYSGINLLNKDSLNKFYINQSKHVFTPRIEMYAKTNNLTIKKIKTGIYKTMWGKCIYNNPTIILNTRLILAPIETVDSVICHELTHLIHPNHSEEFYNTLTNMYPEYYEHHIWLNYFMPLDILC